MSSFESELLLRLQSLEAQSLLRRLRTLDRPQAPRSQIDGRPVINFSSNDYLGLATDPRLQAAAIAATERWGTGSGASRLISGSLQPHHQLEADLSTFKRTEAALSFSSGYATALGTIPALVGSDDVIVLDKLVHASIVDAARLSGAQLRIFRHNDLNSLEEILEWANTNRRGQVLLVTESLFSMDGDLAPLAQIVELKDRYGAWLMVDEAHSTGLFGPNRRGLGEEGGISGQIDIQMGTLGKALGSAGGFIAGSKTLVRYLVNRARSFIFSTAPPPAASAAASEALRIVSSTEGESLVAKLRANIAQIRGSAPFTSALGSPILPWIVGSEETALELASSFLESGVFVPAIRYPSVGRGKARLRFTVSANHSDEDLELVTSLLKRHHSTPAS